MNTLRLRWDSLNYGWQRWVLNYQDEQQSQMLQRWFGKLDGQALGLGLVAVLGLLTGILALVLFKPWRREKMFSSASSIASSACWHARVSAATKARGT